MGRRMLVTGGAGFIGAALVRRLVAEGDEVTLLVRDGSNRSRLQGLEERIHYCRGDVRDEASVKTAVRQARPDAAFHLASTPFNPPTISSQTHLDTIVKGTMNLVEALKDQPHVRVVAAGSAAAYGSGSRLREDAPLRPGTVLGAAKAAASLFLQMAARLYRLHTVELRLFMPYGPGEHPDRLIPRTMLSALEGEAFRMTEGRQQRDVIFLDDVVEAFCLAATQPVSAGSVFNIGSGVGIPVRLLVERIMDLMGHPVKPLVGALPTRPDEIMAMSADIAAAKTRLGWEPRTSLEEGLRRTIAWWTSHRELVNPSLVSPARPMARVPGRAGLMSHV